MNRDIGLPLALIGLSIVAAAIRLSRPAQQELPAEEPVQVVCQKLGDRWLDCRLPDGTRCITEQSGGKSMACDLSANSRLPPLPPCEPSTLGLRAGPVQCIFDPRLGNRWAWRPLP